MTNNQVIRQIRETLALSDSEIVKIFSLAKETISVGKIEKWLKREEDPGYEVCYDDELAAFLNGLIVSRRGAKEGPPQANEKKLTNNIILKKVQIALDLKTEDIINILAMVDMVISKYELSAFFRKPEHKHYRSLRNKVLGSFFKGIQLKYKTQKSD